MPSPSTPATQAPHSNPGVLGPGGRKRGAVTGEGSSLVGLQLTRPWVEEGGTLQGCSQWGGSNPKWTSVNGELGEQGDREWGTKGNRKRRATKKGSLDGTSANAGGWSSPGVGVGLPAWN